MPEGGESESGLLKRRAFLQREQEAARKLGTTEALVWPEPVIEAESSRNGSKT